MRIAFGLTYSSWALRESGGQENLSCGMDEGTRKLRLGAFGGVGGLDPGGGSKSPESAAQDAGLAPKVLKLDWRKVPNGTLAVPDVFTKQTSLKR